jgi:hypothetical protein
MGEGDLECGDFHRFGCFSLLALEVGNKESKAAQIAALQKSFTPCFLV